MINNPVSTPEKVLQTTGGELAPLGEGLRRDKRVVILGSRRAGAYDLQEMLQAATAEHGIIDLRFITTRHAELIEHTFFNRRPVQPQVEEPINPGHRRLGGRIMHQLLGRRSRHAGEDTALAVRSEPPSTEDTLPRAVLLLPEMRMLQGDVNYTIDSPATTVQALCDQYGVPLVMVTRNQMDDRQAIEVATQALTAHLELPPSNQ